MQPTLSFDISHLVDKPTGTREVYTFAGPAELEDLTLKSSISGELEIMRVEDGVNARAKDLEVKVDQECGRCLKHFQQKLRIPHAERIFLIDKPRKVEDINDLFLIDKKHLKIDVSEMFRQEIVLHLPINPVCLTGCVFKSPQNEDQDIENKPLKALKELIK